MTTRSLASGNVITCHLGYTRMINVSVAYENHVLVVVLLVLVVVLVVKASIVLFGRM